MKKYVIATIIAFTSIAYGCKDSVNKENEQVAKVQLQDSSTLNEHKHSLSDSIELNNGAKWKVVPDMMQFIKNMERDVNHFSGTQHTALKDFMQLGASLQKNIELLTSNCTMEGKAHDELHKWLLPYIDMVDEFNKSKNSTEATQLFQEIEASFKLFNIYFE